MIAQSIKTSRRIAFTLVTGFLKSIVCVGTWTIFGYILSAKWPSVKATMNRHIGSLVGYSSTNICANATFLFSLIYFEQWKPPAHPNHWPAFIQDPRALERDFTAHGLSLHLASLGRPVTVWQLSSEFDTIHITTMMAWYVGKTHTCILLCTSLVYQRPGKK